LHIEARQSDSAAKQVEEGNTVTSARELSPAGKFRRDGCYIRRNDEQNAPHERQYRRRNSECNDVGYRVQFAAEIAGRVRHARDAAVKSVKEDCKSDSFSGGSELMVGPKISACDLKRAFKRLQDCQESQKNIGAGEEGWKSVSGAPRAFTRNFGA
jgi:hypothetical protein